MPKGKPKFNTYDLDEFLDTASIEQKAAMVGKRVLWHGGVGTLVMLKNKMLVIKMFFSCYKCRKGRFKVLLTSGLHNGAFCYACDEDGNYVANLRDQVVSCSKCK